MPGPARAAGRTPNPVQRQSGRVRFRRALTLLLMTLVLPGSAQLVAGNAKVGRVALRIWLFLLGCLGVLVLFAWLWPGVLASLAFNTFVLGLIRAVLIGCALGWAVLFIDAWRLGDPLGLEQRQRLTVFGLNGVLCFAVSGALLFGSHLVSVHRSFISDVFGASHVSSADAGRYNVLLLGGDAGKTRWGMRPDSITVASVDAETGRTVLIGLPRNLMNVPFPEGTPMHKAFPDGYDCGTECLLNAVYTWAVDHKDQFPKGVGDVGVWATTKTVEEITGLKINYYAMVDLHGFEELVDAVGGVTITVPERLPIGGGGGPILGWIEPGRQHLNGHEALWFARSRATTDDYSRMARQKCVMSAMLSQLSPTRVVTRFTAIADAGKQVVTTDIPASQLDTFVDLARKARTHPVSTVSLVPPQVSTADPDFDQIRTMIDDAIDRAEQADEGGDEPGGAAKNTPADPAADRAAADTTGAKDQPTEIELEHKQANASDNLKMACG